MIQAKYRYRRPHPYQHRGVAGDRMARKTARLYFQEGQAKLRNASTHWFRHTAVTHGDDAGIGLKYLKRSARHEELETTAIYQHAEDALWHDEWQRHRF